MDWSELEVELTISTYFEMLTNEMLGRTYSKTEYRRKLLPLLSSRSDGSVEFKFQNISAVLINFGQPYIKGYLPRFNYQLLLEEKALDFLLSNRSIEAHFKSFVDREIEPISSFDFEKTLVDPPEEKRQIAMEPEEPYGSKRTLKVNYIELEQRNSSLGVSGEKFVFEYEKWKLIQYGKENLAERVYWISKEEGDGKGFDILSRNPDGSDKYIEVKTTKLGKETPFFFTRNEMNFSKGNSDNYFLFRLFDFGEKTRMFVKNGDLDSICNAIPVSYIATVR